MTQRPLVDRLAKNLGRRASVLRVSIHDDVGKELGKRYGLRTVPFFVIFDAEGEVVWRGNLVPSQERVLGSG